jgi:hypothetical protein
MKQAGILIYEKGTDPGTFLLILGLLILLGGDTK